MTEPGTDRQPAAPRERGPLWTWTKRGLVGLAGLIVVLLLAGVIYQFVATKIDEYRYPAPGEMFPGFSQEESDQFNEAWTKSQADLTQVSQNSEQIIAEESGHNIQADDPDLVIDAIRQVVEAARNGSSV